MRLILVIVFFFIGYFLADTGLVDIPFRNIPILESLYEVVD